MERFFMWIKKNRTKVALLCAALFLVPIILISLIFWIGEYRPLIQTNFTASDILTYWGVFLAALGAISLGLLALWQNHTLSKQTDAAQKRLEELEKSKIKPSLYIEKDGKTDNFTKPKFRLYNRGGGTAINIRVADFGSPMKSEYEHISFTEKTFNEISVGKDEILLFDYTPEKDKKWHVGLAISYSDLYGESHKTFIELYLSKAFSARPTIDEQIFIEKQITEDSTDANTNQ